MVMVSSTYSLDTNVNTTLAELANRQDVSRKLDLNIPINTELYLKLVRYNHILERFEKCEGCYKGFTYNQILNVIQKNINKQ